MLYDACSFQDYRDDSHSVNLVEGIRIAKRQFTKRQVRTQAKRDARRKFRFLFASHTIVYDVRVVQQSTRTYTHVFA